MSTIALWTQRLQLGNFTVSANQNPSVDRAEQLTSLLCIQHIPQARKNTRVLEAQEYPASIVRHWIVLATEMSSYQPHRLHCCHGKSAHTDVRLFRVQRRLHGGTGQRVEKRHVPHSQAQQLRG
ncbi:hypothetical protein FQZ97_1057940 [compost metagenome]